MGAGASHGYNSIEEALADGVSHADLLANGVSQAEFQGDALTTAAWMWDDAAAAARRHKARHTLDE